MHHRDGQCAPAGCVKLSWIAAVFGVHPDSVKRMRRHLVRLGWWVPLRSDHWHRQEHGSLGRVELTWTRPTPQKPPVCHRKSPPVQAPSRPESPPSRSNRNLAAQAENQKPAGRGPAGASRAARKAGPPRLEHVVPEDLADTGRLLELFEQAVTRGLVGGSEMDRLNFVTAAEHARVVGTTNAPGLLIRTLRQRRWGYCTQADEDAARRRLRTYDDALPACIDLDTIWSGAST